MPRKIPVSAPTPKAPIQSDRKARIDALLNQIKSEVAVSKKHDTGPDGKLKAGEGGKVGDGGPDKGMQPTVVNADDPSQVTLYNLAGDEEGLIADTSPKDRNIVNPNYNFTSVEKSALELPVANKGISEVLVFKSIGCGVHILETCHQVNSGGGRCSWVQGDAKVQALLNGAVQTKVMLSDFTKPVIIPLRAGGTALMCKSSNVLGLIAIEAPFAKGMKNANYELYSLKNGMLVNSTGMGIKNPHTELWIASAHSNKSITQQDAKRDLFSEIEQKYVLFQRMAALRADKAYQGLMSAAQDKQRANKELISSLQKQIEVEKTKAAQNVQKVASSLSSLKVKPEVDDMGYIAKENARFLASSRQEFGVQANENVSTLAKWM